jgi:undecaprenyl-diphosphatase
VKSGPPFESSASVPTWAWFGIGAGLAILPFLLFADHAVQGAVQTWQSPPLVSLMQLLTRLGYGALDIGILVALAVVGWRLGDRGLLRRGLMGGATVAGAGMLDQILKNLLCRARPGAPEAGAFFANFPCFPAPYASASFPSGHATTAFALAVLLALWYPRFGWVFLGLAGLVGLSRVILGSHFPSDVLAGAVLGSAVSLAVHACAPSVRRAADVVGGGRSV